MSYLREHEKQGQPLPQPVYHLVLSHLLIPTATYQPTSHTRALAWDLFSHMRLVAHPVPFRDIYSTMIRACGNAGDPQPERARDLWIEMTTEGEKIVPQSEEYDAIVRALSSTKTEYLEAFELLRQMIARHQDAVLVPFEDAPSSAWSRYVPTVATFTALLEGTKRAGDLGRARWIVSEVVRLMRASEAMGEKRLAGPDEEMMAGLFMTYAAWKPMIKREGLKISGSDAKEAEETQEADGLEVDIIADTANTGSLVQYDSQGSSLPSSPRSSADAIREADALFDQTLEATAIHGSQRIHSSSSMRSVHLNPRLVNSYLSVHLAHAPSVGAARDAWLSTWTRVKSVRSSVGPNGWSYLMVLERCSSGSRGGLTTEDRAEAFKWGKQVWEEYSRFAEDSSADAQQEGIIEATSPHRRVNDHAATGRRRRWLAGLGERQVERCWRAIIRLHAIFDDLDTSLRLLDEFHTLHPPSAIVRAYSPLPETDLAIRMTSIGSVPEPDVPPHLIWKDLDVLHQRLVRDEGWKGVGKVKWVTKAYEGALIKRRRYRLKGAGVGRERLREKRLGRMGGRQKVERLGRGDEAGRIGAEKEVEEEGWDDTDELDGGMGGEDMEGLRATS